MEKKCNLFENEGFQELSEGIMRPGGYNITEDGIKLANLNRGMKVLDVGCGMGSTLQHLNDSFGISGIGIDLSDSILGKGRKAHPGLDLRKGEGDQLDFPSKSFDGVLMECTLSLFHNQPEALHEAFCVLKNNGKLIISDFYLRNPEEQVIKQEKARREEIRNDFHEKRRTGEITHETGDCGSGHGYIPIGSCINGAFDKTELINVLEEIGYSIVEWEDRTKELKEFTAEIIMQHGSMENFWKSVLPEGLDSSSYAADMAKVKLGYFLLVARK
jgi:ubiquinone/menaquinone biosynthesis C-methylase UbiE